MVVLSEWKAGRLKLVEAAEAMGVGYRQAKRIGRRYQQQGAAGLVHQLRGRPGGRRRPEELRRRVLERYRQRYPDFGPTLAAEHLAREGLRVDHETLRRWLKAAGEWTPRRHRQKHWQWRERKACFGEMVQMDGSEHDWFEGRRDRAVVMVAVDDATNRVLARFFEGETTEACYDMMERWLQRYGVPRSLYVDRDSIYRCERRPDLAEQLAGKEARTQFGRAMEELGVELILANSPQAKGRVERMNGLLQDRLVKELRLAGIRDLEQANAFLEETFLPAVNQKFGKKAARPADLHGPRPRDLDRILSWAEERRVQRDWTVIYQGRRLQIGREHQSLNLAGRAVEVRRQRDGKIRMWSRGRELRFREMPMADRPPEPKTAPAAAAPPKVAAPPGRDHPWRRFGFAASRRRREPAPA